MQGKVLWHVTMSADGFIAAPDHSMEWVRHALSESGASPLATGVMDRTGAILGWHDVAWARYDGVDGIYGGRWSGPVFVLTTHPEDAPDDPKAAFISAGLEAALAAAREAAEPLSVGILGASVERQCFRGGVLDEIVIHVMPVLLGAGVRLYHAPGTKPVRMTLLDRTETRRPTDLRFRVIKDGDEHNSAEG
jgi:dihydrofolate reductase